MFSRKSAIEANLERKIRSKKPVVDSLCSCQGEYSREFKMLPANDPWAAMESEVQSFRAGTVRFLEILIHFDREKLYAEKGYSSLFALLTERYGFSEGQALRRINCCRAAQVYPACLDHLANGTISVCALATIQQVMTTENAEALITKINGKSIKQIRSFVEALKSVAPQAEPLPLFAPRPPSTLDAIPSEVNDDTKTLLQALSLLIQTQIPQKPLHLQR
jgi:hypothetical protein